LVGKSHDRGRSGPFQSTSEPRRVSVDHRLLVALGEVGGVLPDVQLLLVDAFRAAIDAQFPLLSPIIYCDDDAASPDPVTGINIPDFKNEASGEVSAARVVLKVGTSAAKCYTKAFGLAFKFGGTIPPEYLPKIDACFDKIEAYGMDKMAELDQTQKLPDCLSLTAAQNLVSATVSLAGQFSDENYCASPSGAFLD
jgi:hypothetical protein